MCLLLAESEKKRRPVSEESRKPEVVVQNVPTSSPALKPGNIRGPPSHPPFFHYAEPSLTSMQVRKEKETELKANDEYWKQTLAKREAEFKQNDQAMEKEYNDTVSCVSSLLINVL